MRDASWVEVDLHEFTLYFEEEHAKEYARQTEFESEVVFISEGDNGSM
jgi:hypothetical protein